MNVFIHRATPNDASGYAGGMTPLLDREGKPVVSPIIN